MRPLIPTFSVVALLAFAAPNVPADDPAYDGGDYAVQGNDVSPDSNYVEPNYDDYLLSTYGSDDVDSVVQNNNPPPVYYARPYNTYPPRYYNPAFHQYGYYGGYYGGYYAGPRYYAPRR